MPLTLVTGPANAAKAGSVLGAYRSRLAEEPLLVVPRMDDVDHHQRALAGDGVLMGGHVVRFSWLFEEIARRCGFKARSASRLQVELIAGQAVRRARVDLMSESAARPGFARAASRLFAELERSRVEPGRLGAALKRWGAERGRAQYAGEVTALYSAYRERLEAARLVDPDLFAWRALDSLRHAPERWGRTPVFVYGFDDFTELELEALEILAARAETDVVVSLPYERGRVAFKPLAAMFERLRAVAGERVEELPALDDHYAPEARTPLHALERGLFTEGAPEAVEPGGSAPDGAEPQASPPPTDAIRLLSAGGIRAELELVAAEILELVRSGTRPGDVAVVFRDPTRYAATAQHVFGAYGIPHAVDRRVPLGHTALGRGLLSLLRCASAHGSTADLLAYLRTPGRLRNPALADRLEAAVRRQGVRSADDALRVFEQLAGWPLDEVERLRTAPSAADALLAIAQARLADPYRRRAHVLTGTELDDARAFEAVRRAITDVTAVARAGDKLDFAELHDLLADVEVRTGDAPDPERVQIASPETVRARRFEAVFACGLQEGEWPAPSGGDPFLTDDDRREVAAAGGLALPLREDQLDRERYLFYATVSRAERRLFLSWRHSDEDGNPEARSFFVEDVRDIFGDALAPPRVRDLADVTWSLDEAPTEVEWQRAAALDGLRVAPQVATRLGTPALAAWLAERGGFSAGMLEAFTECPVRWLVDRVLDPGVLEPDPQYLVRGAFAHRVLELTYRRLREATGSARVTGASLPTAERLLHEAITEEQGSFQLSPSETRVRAAVRRLEFDLLRFLQHESRGDSQLEPTELELSFGLPDSPLPPLRLDDIEIRGVIDRVDRANGHALIVDYKSGKNVLGVGKWADKGKLQAPLYALAVKDLMGLVPIGAVYQPLAGDDLRARGVVDQDHKQELGDRFVRTDWKSPDDLDDALEQARDTVRSVVQRMRDGEIQPKPNCCSGGTGCAYPSICRKEPGGPA